MCHSRYNSQEMGQRVADRLTATFSSPYLGDSQLPQLTCGRLTTTALPGGGLFAYAFAAGLQQSGQEGSQVSCNSCVICKAHLCVSQAVCKKLVNVLLLVEQDICLAASAGAHCMTGAASYTK